MRFNICYSLVLKRGFFIHQSFFFYERPVLSSLTYDGGSGVPQFALASHIRGWFELHSSAMPTQKSFTALGASKAPLFGLLLISLFSPNLGYRKRYSNSVARLFKILTYRGKRLSQRLPARGQRSHSNCAVSTSRRFNSSIISSAFFKSRRRR